ncbi:MAG: HPr(Ser) kinase/phosphatase [Proteobacteria bacterium]|nr:HPr(Ser) kinase/phosphatase [Pseudomonadota bacterium]
MKVLLEELLEREPAEQMSLKLVAGERGLANEITTSSIQKPGLLLTGQLENLYPDRIQIFGVAEINYLSSIDGAKLERSLNFLTNSPMTAIVVTRGLTPQDFLVDLAEKKGIPVFTTPLTSSLLIHDLSDFLDDRLAEEITMHGVLVDVMGIGILITGKSGIGKSECALDLISRGHRLVADDAVIVKKKQHPSTLFGIASDIISYHMEIRGIGIINIKDIFGITAIRKKKQMDMILELVDWESDGEYERLGFDEKHVEVLGINLPHLRIPVSPGRSVATIIEVAARDRILKITGYDSSREFEARVLETVVVPPIKVKS